MCQTCFLKNFIVLFPNTLFLPSISPSMSLSLETSGRLMELGHKDGRLRVHYSDKLVTLLREVRQLSALGFPVPSKIQHTSSIAEKFYRHAVVLKQVYTCIALLKPVFACTERNCLLYKIELIVGTCTRALLLLRYKNIYVMMYMYSMSQYIMRKSRVMNLWMFSRKCLCQHS